jgi:hypothetical protein
MNATISYATLQSATGDPVTARFTTPITGYQGDPLYVTASVTASVLAIAIVDQPPSEMPAPGATATSATVSVSYNGTTSDTVTVPFDYSGNALSLGMTIDAQLTTATVTVTEATFEDERARHARHKPRAKRKNADGSRTEAPFGFVVIQGDEDTSVYQLYWVHSIASVRSPGRFKHMTIVEPGDDGGGLSGPMGGMIP